MSNYSVYWIDRQFQLTLYIYCVCLSLYLLYEKHSKITSLKCNWNTLDPVIKNGFIDTTSAIDGRLTAVATTPCMTTISPNSILYQQTQLLPHSKHYQHPNSACTYDNIKSLSGPVPANGTIGHNNNISSGSNCHPSINQTKNSSITMSQLSTVYATKRRRRNGKRYVALIE